MLIGVLSSGTLAGLKKSLALTVLTFALTSGAHAASIVFASNFNSNTVTAYDYTAGTLLGTAVTGGPETAGFNGVLRLPDNSFLVAGQLSDNIVRYGADGALLSVFDPANSGGLTSPQALTLGPDAKLYAVSSANDKILKYDPVTGNFLREFADLSGSGHIGPIDLKFGPDGNLYVTAFDSGQVVKLDGNTGAILSTTPAPDGIAFADSAFGPDGNLYIGGLNPVSFAGSVYRFHPSTGQISVFIANGTGGLESPGGLAFGPDGFLIVGNLLVDENFNDAGSSLLKFNAGSGTFAGTLVGPGQGLNVPFFISLAQQDLAAPEPGTAVLLGMGLLVLAIIRWALSARRRYARAIVYLQR